MACGDCRHKGARAARLARRAWSARSVNQQMVTSRCYAAGPHREDAELHCCRQPALLLCEAAGPRDEAHANR